MSGTVLLNVFEGGDFDELLSVDGSHDLVLDEFGVMDPDEFAAYPWTGAGTLTDTRWKNVDERRRRAPSALIAEEQLAAIAKGYAQNALSTNHDALNSWELPDGSSPSAWASGGTQLDGHVWCKRAWWIHHCRQRYCVERAIQRPNLWGTSFTGSHSGSGTISGSTFSGSGTGTLTGTPSGSYSITIAGTLTGAGPDGTFEGSVSGALTGTYTGTIVAGAVTSVIWDVTSPAGFEVSSTGSSFTVGGGGTTFDFDGAFSGGKTPGSHAETFVNAEWADSGVAPTQRGIGKGKMHWNLGWRKLAVPWSPVLTKYNNFQASVRFADFLWLPENSELGEPYWPPWNDNSEGGGNDVVSANPGILMDEDGGIAATYVVFLGDRFMCSAGDVITRPRSSLRNVFGFDDGDFIRYGISGIVEDGLSANFQFGFFWWDQTESGTPGSTVVEFLGRHFANSVVLGGIGSTEGNFDLDAALDELWAAVGGASNPSDDRRVPCFWIGPEWGVTPGAAGSYSCSGGDCTANAAGAAANHFLPWGGGRSGWPSPRIGTTKYPFCYNGNASGAAE